MGSHVGPGPVVVKKLPSTAELDAAAQTAAAGGVTVAVRGGKKAALAVLPWLAQKPGEGPILSFMV